jgi:hypothetical protein
VVIGRDASGTQKPPHLGRAVFRLSIIRAATLVARLLRGLCGLVLGTGGPAPDGGQTKSKSKKPNLFHGKRPKKGLTL